MASTACSWCRAKATSAFSMRCTTFPSIDAVTCRHEAGAGFMAVADGRLTRRPGVALVSRGPGATNASIAVHTAQQDAIPMILIVGQVPRADLRREAFQEIDYQRMYGTIAKWVFEATDPGQLAEAAFKAIRLATSGTPGPVVLVIPEDLQQQPVRRSRNGCAHEHAGTQPDEATLRQLLRRIETAQRPLIVAGGGLEAAGGREALRALAERGRFRSRCRSGAIDLFSNLHPLYAGELGLANPQAADRRLSPSDLILALGTRFGDITSQGYTLSRPAASGADLRACLSRRSHRRAALRAGFRSGVRSGRTRARADAAARPEIPPARAAWATRLQDIREAHAAWPQRPRRGRHRFRAGGEGGARAGERRCHRLPGRGHLRRAGLPPFRLRAAAAADVAAVGHHGLRHARRDRRAAALSRTAGDLHGGRRRIHDDRQRDDRGGRAQAADPVHPGEQRAATPRFASSRNCIIRGASSAPTCSIRTSSRSRAPSACTRSGHRPQRRWLARWSGASPQADPISSRSSLACPRCPREAIETPGPSCVASRLDLASRLQLSPRSGE